MTIVQDDEPVEQNDFFNVKLVVGKKKYFGQLTIFDILARHYNSSKEDF